MQWIQLQTGLGPDQEFEDKVRIESYFENILRGAMDLIKKDSQADQKTL